MPAVETGPMFFHARQFESEIILLLGGYCGQVSFRDVIEQQLYEQKWSSHVVPNERGEES